MKVGVLKFAIWAALFPKAKIAKDVSAGAVLVMAIGAAIVGIIIFIPKIVQIF